MPRIIGIDWSMSCPALCLWSDERGPEAWWFSTARKTPYASLPPNVTVHHHTLDVPDVERFSTLATAAVTWIEQQPRVECLHMEDYAYAAKGRIFHIGECAGQLKYQLWRSVPLRLHLVAPTAAKKQATGKGNADKLQVFAAFQQHEPLIASVFLDAFRGDRALIASPLTDLADAYWIARTQGHT